MSLHTIHSISGSQVGAIPAITSRRWCEVAAVPKDPLLRVAPGCQPEVATDLEDADEPIEQQRAYGHRPGARPAVGQQYGEMDTPRLNQLFCNQISATTLLGFVNLPKTRKINKKYSTAQVNAHSSSYSIYEGATNNNKKK